MSSFAPSGARCRAAVLGHPIAHSLSPVLHRSAYAALGLTGWTYEAIDVEEARLGDFVAGLDGTWAGLSLTMPLKRVVRPFLSGISELAAQVGAVNTVVVADDGLHGHNTDVHGIVSALREAGVTRPGAAAVLGGGATAASTLAALGELGCADVVVHVRAPDRAGDLLAAAERLGVQVHLAAMDASAVHDTATRVRESGGALVSTLPAGAADELAHVLVEGALGAGRRDPAAASPGLPALLDVVYAPWPTVLARAWAAAGGPVAGGFAMLVHQAVGQVELMTGRRPPLDVMRAAGQAELDARERAVH